MKRDLKNYQQKDQERYQDKKKVHERALREISEGEEEPYPVGAC